MSRCLQGRAYLMKAGTAYGVGDHQSAQAQINVNTLEHTAASGSSSMTSACASWSSTGRSRSTAIARIARSGGFILIDRLTTARWGLDSFNFRAAERSQNVQWQALDVDKQARSRLKGQKRAAVATVSRRGKSTSPTASRRSSPPPEDTPICSTGDNVRTAQQDLGFTAQDRVGTFRRVAEVSRLMSTRAFIVLVSFISPFRSERRMRASCLRPGSSSRCSSTRPGGSRAARREGLYRRRGAES